MISFMEKLREKLYIVYDIMIKCIYFIENQ